MTHTDKAEKISITLPSDMLNTIKAKVGAGAFGSTSEVIREAMRIWQRREEQHEAQLSLIRDRLERSANSGTPVPLDTAFDQIEQMHQERLIEGRDENI